MTTYHYSALQIRGNDAAFGLVEAESESKARAEVKRVLVNRRIAGFSAHDSRYRIKLEEQTKQ